MRNQKALSPEDSPMVESFTLQLYFWLNAENVTISTMECLLNTNTFDLFIIRLRLYGAATVQIPVK